ncbi:MAG: hypothetical protein IT383_19110 [Deltaproteobacteria bacterium]|nr:hypothetical protein [Deltaproteobacteria bacterium]
MATCTLLSLTIALAATPLTESAATIGDQRVGLDADLMALSSSTVAASPTLRLGSATLRIGVAEQAELMVRPPGVNAAVLTGGSVWSGPAAARLKVTALKSEDGAWGLAAMPYVIVPLSIGTIPAVGLAMPVSMPLPAGLALSVMPAVQIDSNGAPTLPLTAAVSWPVFSAVTAYGEVGVAATPLALAGTRWLGTSGVSVALHPAIALDAGVSAQSADLSFAGGFEGTGFVGVSLRM